MRKGIVILILAVLSLNCTDRDDDIKEVNIRVHNVSDLVFNSVQVGAEDKIHENVAPDDFTEYLIYEEAYTYAYIEIVSGEETYVLQPIDFVGETPLPKGLYTYELDITAEGEVILNFVID